MHFFYNDNNKVLIGTTFSINSNFEKVNKELFINNETGEFNLYNPSEKLSFNFKNGYNKFNEEQISEIKNLINTKFNYDLTSGVVVGKVQSCEVHPNSDHMHVLKVNIGTDILDIVCGASNIKEGLYVAVAKPKAYMESIDLYIKPTKLRGIDSFGMVCSKFELGLIEEKVKGI